MKYLFFIGISSADLDLLVSIVSEEYFNKNKHKEDRYLQKELLKAGLLPSYLVECGRGLFGLINHNPSFEQVKQDMLALGYIQSKEFDNFCETHDPFSPWDNSEEYD